MEIMIYILINITLILACVRGSCVKEQKKGTGGIGMSCSVRWSGEGSDIRRLTIRSWDGSCRFPTGARLTLYGANQDCLTCSIPNPERVIVNGERCTSAAPMVRSQVHSPGSERTTTGPTDSTTESYSTSSTESYSTAAESYSTVSRFLDDGSSPRWTQGLLATLAVSVLVLFVILVALLLRFRRQRAYICCKPRTSPCVSMESVMVYQPVPTLQL